HRRLIGHLEVPGVLGLTNSLLLRSLRLIRDSEVPSGSRLGSRALRLDALSLIGDALLLGTLSLLARPLVLDALPLELEHPVGLQLDIATLGHPLRAKTSGTDRALRLVRVGEAVGHTRLAAVPDLDAPISSGLLELVASSRL